MSPVSGLLLGLAVLVCPATLKANKLGDATKLEKLDGDVTVPTMDAVVDPRDRKLMALADYNQDVAAIFISTKSPCYLVENLTAIVSEQTFKKWALKGGLDALTPGDLLTNEELEELSPEVKAVCGPWPVQRFLPPPASSRCSGWRACGKKAMKMAEVGGRVVGAGCKVAACLPFLAKCCS